MFACEYLTSSIGDFYGSNGGYIFGNFYMCPKVITIKGFNGSIYSYTTVKSAYQASKFINYPRILKFPNYGAKKCMVASPNAKTFNKK